MHESYHYYVHIIFYTSVLLGLIGCGGSDPNLQRQTDNTATPASKAVSESKLPKRFTANGDGTIADIEFGLMWADRDTGKNSTWSEAQNHIKQYRGGGYSDWRLPTIKELHSLREAQVTSYQNSNNYLIQLDQSLVAYWTSESHSSGPASEAAAMNFDNGKVVWLPMSSNLLPRALAVRSVLSGEIKPSRPAAVIPSIEPSLAARQMHVATDNGDIDQVKRLLDRGADVNARHPEAGTPLHTAVYNGHEAIVTLLLSKGADVNARANGGFTPLYLSTQRGHKTIVSLLLAKGADVNARTTQSGSTPLHMAVQEGHEAIAALLVSKGASVNARERQGSTPLYTAAREGDEAMVRLLLLQGANVNAKTENGTTPLHVSAKLGHLAIVSLLINQGADINARNMSGTTALSAAANESHKNIVELLKRHGAK